MLDRSVRGRWQIEAGQAGIVGERWEKALASVLERVADGFGLPADRVRAQLYKLLVCEADGFFAEHRDTEKADGMVATLGTAVPAEGEGRELVVRHGCWVAALDLCVDEL